uniref:uncharacterized protein n=1 Tax=Semicossyphus pulcher TaxID=241346 RepID=UPI0037E72B6E
MCSSTAEVRGYLVKILQNERSQKDKAYDELHVDTIMCINPMAEEARKISSDLSNRVQEVCFKELLLFLERYTAEQTERLSKEAKMEQPNMMHFFKTLNICKELRKYVQSKSEISLCKETTATLEKMEAFTLELLLEIVADVAERHLKNYFTTNNHRFLLLSTLKTLFPKAEICQEIQKRVMDEVYKLITHIYLKHLIQRSQRKLQKQWSHDVGKVVAEDAGLLDDIFKHLAPGVQQWNRMLLKVAELLECNDIEAVKLTVATMQNDCPTWSEDLNLLPALLRWKDLSGWQVREVLDAIPGNEPRSVSCFSCLKCW